MPEEKKTYNKNDDVPESGQYVCVPCGFTKEYHEGDKFEECTSCLAGTPEGDNDFAEGLELWEKLTQKHLNKK